MTTGIRGNQQADASERMPVLLTGCSGPPPSPRGWRLWRTTGRFEAAGKSRPSG